MNEQLNIVIEPQADMSTLRDLLDSEVVLVGGGEVVVTGI